jgi:CNT family concentrative nucleoside transporter
MYERSVVIATYALCGFAHIPSLAIFVGGTASIVPERTKDISVLGLWALLASNVACLITGAVAGIFYTGGGTILSK